jgi:hypothetical protein
VSAPSLDDALRLLPFQRDVIAYLRSHEADLWAFYADRAGADERARATRLELLKTAYRCEREAHAAWYAAADEVAGRLGLQAPVTLYQSQDAATLNAFLSYAPGEAHVVFQGPVHAVLDAGEVRATLAHELTHFLLYEAHGGDLMRALDVLSAMAAHPRAEPSHVETARVFRLYLEVHADRGAGAVCGDHRAPIGSLVKIETGLADAQVDAYLRQADEVFGQEEVRTDGLTHPESFVRARALALWMEQGDAAEEAIARMIEGRLDLGCLTLLGQERLTRATRWLLGRFLAPAWLRSEARLAHARMFFPDLDPDAADAPAPPDELERMTEGVARYACYVLLDLATVDQQVDEPALAAALRMAEDLGIDVTFLEVAGRELALAKRNLARLRKEAAQIVARAAGDAGGLA